MTRPATRDRAEIAAAEAQRLGFALGPSAWEREDVIEPGPPPEDDDVWPPDAVIGLGPGPEHFTPGGEP